MQDAHKAGILYLLLIKSLAKGYGNMSAFIARGDGSVWNWGKGYLGNYELATEQVPRQIIMASVGRAVIYPHVIL